MTSTETKPDPRLMEARAYVQTRFYPALPPVYGDLAVEAIDTYYMDGYSGLVTIPEGTNPTPRQAFEDEDGNLVVRAGDLITALRLEHMVDEEQD